MDELNVYAWDRTQDNAAEMIESMRDTGYTFVPVTCGPTHNALDTATSLSNMTDDDLTNFIWTDVDDFGSLGWEKRVLAGGVRRDMLNVTGGLIDDDRQWTCREHQKLRAVCAAAHSELLDILTQVYTAVDIQLSLNSPTTQLINRTVSTLRILWYVGVQAPEESPYPTPPHTDLGIVTAVVQDPSGGLEVNINGDWCRLPVLNNHALVAVGDLLETITQGSLKSRQHRVPARPQQASNGGNRVSLVLFGHPASDFELNRTMLNPRWETAGDYLSYRLTHKNEPIS